MKVRNEHGVVVSLREFARGQRCQVRLPGCLEGTETVVLAHIRRGGVAGVGMKPPDLCGIHACHSCHDIIDGRKLLDTALFSRDDLDTVILAALCRTLALVSKNEVIDE